MIAIAYTFVAWNVKDMLLEHGHMLCWCLPLITCVKENCFPNTRIDHQQTGQEAVVYCSIILFGDFFNNVST